MQQLTLLGNLCILSILCELQLASAATLHVPSGFPTIQSALDSVGNGDTVLVDTGVYAETLLMSRNRTFWLKGNVTPDTGDYPRPVIDPSTLENPTTLMCLRIIGGLPTVEDFVFRNGPQMFPHEREIPGGVYNGRINTTFRRCIFDSTHYGLQTASANLENCEFHHNSSICVYAHLTRLIATDCSFENYDRYWATVDAGSNSVFTRCSFWQDNSSIMELLLLTGSNVTVQQCQFSGRGPTGTNIYLSINSGLIQENEFSDFTDMSMLINVNIPADSSLIFRNNSFHDNHSPDSPGMGGVCLGISTETYSVPSAIRIVENTFRDCTARIGATAMTLSCNALMDSNRITRMSTSEDWGNILAGGDTTIWRSNLFYDNGFVLESQNEATADARWNWWGDSTGPRAVTNPNGLGDSISQNVLYDSWYADSNFFSESPEPPKPLPEIAILEVFPNPFNFSATLRLTVPKAVIVRLELFDILGRKLSDLWSGPVSFEKEISINSPNLSSGLYFARAYDTIGNRPIAFTKLLLLK